MQGSCPLIKNFLGIDFRNGKTQIGSCCVSGKFDVPTSSIDSYLKHPELLQIKQDNDNNIISDDYCRHCLDMESIQQKSKRNYHIESIQNGVYTDSDKLTGIEVHIGNLCNLKCTICSPLFSTQWIPDYERMGRNVDKSLYYQKKEKFIIEDPQILCDLEFVRIYGGEPLMSDTHVEILKSLDSVGILDNVTIQYSTNGTHRVTDEVLELWGKAKLLQLYFSIDDIEQRFEYQRYGANWDSVNENLQWFTQNLEPNHLLGSITSIGYLNICNLNNLIKWKEQNFSTNRLGDHNEMMFQLVWGDLQISKITPDQKVKLLENLPDDLKSYADFPTLDESYTHSKVFGYLNELDKIRNTNWRKTFPELIDIFDQPI